MKKELHIFLNALTFYTRIPSPVRLEYSKSNFNESIRYFPLIGWIIGVLMAVVIYFSLFYFHLSISIILALSIAAIITGAFHEDGFADVCDGIGGGWNKEDILRIMKDSRIGTFGTMGLILLIILKFHLLFGLIQKNNPELLNIILLLVNAHTSSRFMAMTFIFTHKYVRDTPDTKSKPVAQNPAMHNLFVGLIFTLIPLVIISILFSNYYLLLILPALYIPKVVLGRYFKKWIGGYTGDCLGATQQIIEIFYYLFYIIIWKYS